MQEQTDREYLCSLSLIEDKSLENARDEGCGGIVAYSDNFKIMCPNMLISRLNVAFEESLPNIRDTLFPSTSKNAEK